MDRDHQGSTARVLSGISLKNGLNRRHIPAEDGGSSGRPAGAHTPHPGIGPRRKREPVAWPAERRPRIGRDTGLPPGQAGLEADIDEVREAARALRPDDTPSTCGARAAETKRSRVTTQAPGEPQGRGEPGEHCASARVRERLVDAMRRRTRRSWRS